MARLINLIRRLAMSCVATWVYAMVPLFGHVAEAQEWPKQQPIKILVGFAAGGGNDVFARLVGQKLSEKLGQTVVIENRTGAGSIIAYDATARAAPDGYTLVVAPFGATIVNPAVYTKLPYDPAQFRLFWSCDRMPVSTVSRISSLPRKRSRTRPTTAFPPSRFNCSASS